MLYGRIFLPSGQKNRAFRGSASLHSLRPALPALKNAQDPPGLSRPSNPLRGRKPAAFASQKTASLPGVSHRRPAVLRHVKNEPEPAGLSNKTRQRFLYLIKSFNDIDKILSM
jgi:hypothetical protein